MAELGDAPGQGGGRGRHGNGRFRGLQGTAGQHGAPDRKQPHRNALPMARYTFQAYVMRAWRQAVPFNWVQAAL